MKRFMNKWLLTIPVLLLNVLLSEAQGEHPFSKEVDQLCNKEYHPDPSKKLLLFAGSSSIRKWKDVQNYFPGYNVINYGFGGSKYSDLLFFYDKLFRKYKPDILFIYEGDNDIAAGTAPAEIAEEAETLIKKLRKDLPETRIVIISAKPSLARWHLKDQYLELNEKLKNLCGKYPDVAYANVWDIMLDREGQPRKDIFIGDGLHMNKKGYELWKKILSGYLMPKTRDSKSNDEKNISAKCPGEELYREEADPGLSPWLVNPYYPIGVLTPSLIFKKVKV